jgi:hypothetical protein
MTGGDVLITDLAEGRQVGDARRQARAVSAADLEVDNDIGARRLLIRGNSGTGDLEDYAKLPAGLPLIRKIPDIRPGFRVNFFSDEDFVYLYDELSSPRKMSSRSCRLSAS